MSANLQLYEQEVIAFLQSCTITFSPLATQINNNVIAAGGTVDNDNPYSWKYYLNLSGAYHSSDTVMTVVSLDTKQVVQFTPAMLASNAKTKAAYTIGSSYYTALCQAYPGQTDLIKSIVYPVDINTAVNAADFTLLGWGNGYLEDTEQDAILYELNTFIAYASQRWYFGFFSYEAYYVWAFWSLFWQSLPNAIFAARLKQLHTSSAHSFHIWSYLQSRGIGDYSDILTSQQALFLYRNLNYLEQNRGKQSNLVILVNHLLTSLNVGLVGKTVYMNTLTNAAICQWTPEFVSIIIPTFNSQNIEQIPPQTMAGLNAELITAGLEVDSDATYIASEQTKIGNTTLNILPTKLVEIQKLGIDQKYGSLLNEFILDTLVWSITSGLYVPDISIIDPTTSLPIALSGPDVLALYYYAIHRSCREQPVSLPVAYAPRCAFRPNVTAASIPAGFVYGGLGPISPPGIVDDILEFLTLYPHFPRTKPVALTEFEDRQRFQNHYYPTKSYLSLDLLLDGVGYPQGPITDANEFSDMVANLFLVLIRYVRYSRTESSAISLAMFENYCTNHILQSNVYRFSLTSAANYPAWIASHKLTALFAALDAQPDDVDAYGALCNTITTALLPEDSPVYTFFAYTNPSTDDLYDRLRSLFIQLCSYNVAFLDTNRTNAWWFLYNRVVYQMSSIVDEVTFYQNGLLQPGTIEQHDTVPLQAIATTIEAAVNGMGTINVNIAYSDTYTINPFGNDVVQVPLMVDVQCTGITDTHIMPSYSLLRTAVMTATTSGVV